jgi:hypothetical protein
VEEPTVRIKTALLLGKFFFYLVYSEQSFWNNGTIVAA